MTPTMLCALASLAVASVPSATPAPSPSPATPVNEAEHARPTVLPAPRALAATVHPAVRLLDPEGRPVIESGGPISSRESCGGCHDAAWIEEHSYHAQLGADRPYRAGEAPRPWDTHAGPFGRWDPLVYRRLSAPDEARPDADLEAWARILGPRHVGGGPFAPLGGQMSCLSCHAAGANEEARRATIARGEPAWQATAALAGGPIVEATEDGFRYRPEAFDEAHEVRAEDLGLTGARSEACGSCHGTVPEPGEAPVRYAVEDFARADARSATGLVFAAQPMLDSAVNLAGKQALTRSWDVHAERLVPCSGCHGTLNDPANGARAADAPTHLRFDARGEALKDYLRRPQHDFATGYAAPGVLGAEHAGSMRRCEDCHDAGEAHDWLPYADRHLGALLCESCHVPAVHAPLLESVDWTVLTEAGQPKLSYRGVDGDPADPRTLVAGVTPTYLRREAPGEKLGPHNLVTSFYWVEGDNPRPVRLEDLEAAYLEGGRFAPPIVEALDEDGDGALSAEELHLGTEARVDAVRARLEALGVESPRLAGEVQPYGLHHQIAGRGFALKSCASCHSAASRLTASTRLSPRAPAGVTVDFVADAPVQRNGEIVRAEGGALVYRPDAREARIYVLGAGAPDWVDLVGWAAVLLVLIGGGLHAAARLWAERARASRGESS